MTLFLNNEDVARVLTMGDTIAALEKAYDEIAAGEAVCRPRIDVRIPTSDPAYRPDLDLDGDGLACEPAKSRRSTR